MASQAPAVGLNHRPSAHLWIPIAVGLAALLLPTYARLHDTLWNEEAYEHGPIIVAVFWWLLWRHRDALFSLQPQPRPVEGFALLMVGLFAYYVGRTQNLAMFEVAAQLPIFMGVLVSIFGVAAIRLLWFPLLFLIFLIPPPGFVIVGITGALKHHVSIVAESLLYHVGYPVARDGVVITVGQYQMLVADACSGLNSMYSLSALGLLYMYLMQRKGIVHNALLLGSILPIAFAANVVRVIMLILLTYHFGDEVGQGFLHNASGIVLFLVALALLFSVDGMLAWIRARLTKARHAS